MEEREIAVGILPNILARMEEKQKVMKEMHEILRESNKETEEVDRERWKHEKPKAEAEAARTARFLFVRNMKKLKARLNGASDGSIIPM